MSELLKTLITEQIKVTGNFLISRQENIEKSADNKNIIAKVIVYRLLNWFPIYRSIVLLQ
jgi:hypothetical protein